MKTLRIVLLASGLLPLHLHGADLKYFVYQSLSASVGTSVGKIQILRDARLRNVKRIPLDIDGPQAVTYTSALLRLLDPNGQKLEVHQLEKPMAWIKRSELDSPGPTFEVTVDFSTGFGTYTGPMTSFVSIDEGKLRWLEACNADGTKKHVVRFLDNGYRSYWKVKDPHTIFFGFAHPDVETGTRGVQKLSRYSFDGKRWVITSKEGPGAQDFEMAFPKDSEFP